MARITETVEREVETLDDLELYLNYHMAERIVGGDASFYHLGGFIIKTIQEANFKIIPPKEV